MRELQLVASAFGAYLIGSIPMGYVWVKILTGRDVRRVGSGRTGGTNAARAGGRIAGILTGVGDFLKGLVAVLLAQWLLPVEHYGALSYWAQVAAGSAAVIGHNWSIYLGFRGGAGTGPNLGVAAAFAPAVGLALVPLVPLLLVTTGYASVASLTVAVAIPLVFAVLALAAGWPWAYAVYGIITLILVALALRPNIRRLIKGTERRVGPRAKDQAAGNGQQATVDRE